MGQKDLYQSDFYEDKSRFADAFNGVLFGGTEVMRPEELKNEDSVIVSLRKNGSGKRVICDKIKRWKGKYVSIMVLENQSYVDYHMVLRVMEAEVISYDKQRKELYLSKRNEKVKFGQDEYLSRMKKGEKFIPIITLVLYMGKDKLWDGAGSLYEMLEIDDAIKPYVNDYKINLFDYHDYEDFSMFRTENRMLFEMLSCAGNKQKMLKILGEQADYGGLDEASAKAILGILGVAIDLNTIVKKDEKGREVYDMCQAFENYREDGRKEGLKQGLEEGLRQGELTMALKIVKNLMKKQDLSFEDATSMLGISKRMQKELTTLI